MNISRFLFCLWNLVLVGHAFSYPDKYEIQDADTNKKINLLDLLKDYEESDREQRRDSTEESVESWTGRWMPHKLNEATPPPKVLPSKNNDENKEAHHDRIPMGLQIPTCDDGKTNLTVDWDYSESAMTCYGRQIKPNLQLSALEHCKKIANDYVADHKCMNTVIEYKDDVPLYGTHRPVWPVYGEYTYVPRQRWLHSLEHGAIVFLYHPCANEEQVEILRQLVRSCLRRHIITPYNLLDEERPLALLSWGCSLSMAHVNTKASVDFIKAHAIKAPEQRLYQHGGFHDQLKERARIVSDIRDSTLCPKM